MGAQYYKLISPAFNLAVNSGLLLTGMKMKSTLAHNQYPGSDIILINDSHVKPYQSIVENWGSLWLCWLGY